MRDVARFVGVSQSTVSRVLSGSTESQAISQDTHRRVLDAVESLGYQPNVNAGSLRGRKSRMIAVMIADIANPFYHPMVRAIQDVASRHRYDVMVSNTDYTRAGEQHFLQAVMRRPSDGIIMVVSHLDDVEVETLMRRTGAVLGVVGQKIQHPLVDIAFADDGKAFEDAAVWLAEQKGHRRLGFIGVEGKYQSVARRQRAFQRALERCGLPQRSQYEVAGDWSPASGHLAMRRLLDLEEPPTVVLACNDLMAIGAMVAAREKGLSIPRDVALVGFDDIPAASWLSPSLTTIAQFPYAMGEQLAMAVFERLVDGYSGPGRRFEIPCRFIEREST